MQFRPICKWISYCYLGYYLSDSNGSLQYKRLCHVTHDWVDNFDPFANKEVADYVLSSKSNGLRDESLKETFQMGRACHANVYVRVS